MPVSTKPKKKRGRPRKAVDLSQLPAKKQHRKKPDQTAKHKTGNVNRRRKQVNWWLPEINEEILRAITWQASFHKTVKWLQQHRDKRTYSRLEQSTVKGWFEPRTKGGPFVLTAKSVLACMSLIWSLFEGHSDSLGCTETSRGSRGLWVCCQLLSLPPCKDFWQPMQDLSVSLNFADCKRAHGLQMVIIGYFGCGVANKSASRAGLGLRGDELNHSGKRGVGGVPGS